MIRIAFICSHLSVGGAERVIEKQCSILQKHNAEILVICTDNFGETGRKLFNNGVFVLDLTTKKDIIANSIESFNPDIIFIHNAAVANILKKKTYTLAMQIHGSLDNNSFSRRLLNSYIDVIDGIITSHPVSHKIAKDIVSCIHAQIFNPVGGEFFSKNIDVRRENIVGYCGRISPEKSLVSFAEICSLVQREIPDVKAKIIGDADTAYTKCLDYKRRVEKAFQVPLTITGFINPVDEMLSLKAGFLGSTSEGFCNFLWEAAALGVPVVSSNVGSAYMIADRIVEVDGTSELSEEACEQFASHLVGILKSSPNRESLRQKALPSHEQFYEHKFLDFLVSCKNVSV